MGIAASLVRLGWRVWAVLAVALVLRLVAGEFVAERIDGGADARDYARIGLSIAHGDGYPTHITMQANGGPSALRAPAYPLLLAGVFKLTGDSELAARAGNALLGTLTVALLGLIAWQLWRRREIALAAMSLAAVYPPLIAIGIPLMSESLFLPLLLGAVACALEQRRSAGLRWAALAGLLTGLALLTRSAGLPLLLPLALAVWTARPRFTRASLAPVATLLGVAALTVTPWTIRNAIEFSSFVPVTTHGGVTLNGAYNEQTKADPAHFWLPQGALEENRDLYDGDKDEAEVSSELTRRSLELIADHPLYPFEYAWDNAGRLFEIRPLATTLYDAEGFGFAADSHGTTTFELLFGLNRAGFAVLVALALAGAVMGGWRRIPPALWLMPLLVVVTSIFLSGSTRYRLPADLFLILVAAFALGGWVRATLGQRRLRQH